MAVGASAGLCPVGVSFLYDTGRCKTESADVGRKKRLAKCNLRLRPPWMLALFASCQVSRPRTPTFMPRPGVRAAAFASGQVAFLLSWCDG